MDLEDGVALNQKDAARAGAAAALRTLEFGRAARLVRINPVTSDGWREDLQAILPAMPDGIVLPKVETPDHIRQVAEEIVRVATSLGRPPEQMVLLGIIETGLGVVNIREIAAADPHLGGLAFGAEDFAGDIGAKRTPSGHEVALARSLVVLHARAYRLVAIDTPFINITDLDGLRLETQKIDQMGFTGKLAIHPAQVAVIQQTLTPSQDQIRDALNLIRAHDLHQAAGVGVFAHEGKMIDMPMIRAAQTIIARAQAARIVLE
jgi:citrate lyase beta subunit